MYRSAAHRVMWTERARTLVLWLLALLVAVSVGALLAAKPAHADLFVVNRTGDTGDERPGDGWCSTGVRIVHEDGAIELECTLRAAIEEANATTAADTVNFAIPGFGPHIISPTSALPTIIQPVTINGYSEGRTTRLDPFDDARENTLTQGTNAVLKIVLDGANRFIPGLTIRTSECVVKGLVINGFSYGMDIGGSAAFNNRVEGNFIGTNASGTAGRGNFKGLAVFGGSGNNIIGGDTPAARNIISANFDTGIQIQGSSSGSASGNIIQGNLIGTTKDGTTALGNSGIGISLSSGQNTMGGNGVASNTIAFNGDAGASVFGTRNSILANSIYDNGSLGIDLGADGVTANDTGDRDAGPNTLQNFPQISSAVTSNGSTTITGALRSTPNRTFTLRFFSSRAPDPSGFGEGRTFLGQRKVTTNSKGNASFTFTPAQPVLPSNWVTATATGTGGTSEFSQARTVVQPTGQG